MSEPTHDTTHGATTVRASKGGGGGKWLLGAAAAVVLLGGGYLAWKNYAPSQSNADIAFNDPYASDSLRAAPLDENQDALAESASTDESAAPASAPRRTASSARRSTASASDVPEETIGVTPVSLTTSDSEEIVVPGTRRPVWVRTPTARRLTALYPERALADGTEGEAQLHCTVQDGGALDCVRVSSTPGFGNAALRVANSFRHAPQRADGSSAAGTPVNLRVVFRMEDDARHG